MFERVRKQAEKYIKKNKRKKLWYKVVTCMAAVVILSEIEDKKYEVKVTNVNEDYFEIEARNQKEAALIVAKFVI